MNSTLSALLAALQENQASDLFLPEGEVPRLRLGGEVIPLATEPVGKDLLDELWSLCGADPQARDADAAIYDDSGARYRVNLLSRLGRRSAVLRRILARVPGMEELGLPADLLRGWLERRAGLILLCGPTGSGKSTSVASMIDWINENRAAHIVTVEDPVEYLFTPRKALISQRETGLDTESFAEGLRRALRQSPDVIFVGEIRDRETAQIALQASETGHLVLSTLHVSRAVEAVTRLRLLFPPNEREMISRVLSRELIGVMCQRLLPATAGGLRPAIEYFSNVGIAGQYLAEDKTAELEDWAKQEKNPDARTFTRNLLEQWRAGLIGEDAARRAAPEPQELNRALRGLV
jgi:twitching motility protein PilT